jgi:hypothetical protein
MANHMDTLKLTTIQAIFPDELQWLRDHRWDFVKDNFTYLSLLHSDSLSKYHLNQIRVWINAEKSELARKEQAERKAAQLPSGHTLTASGAPWRN